MLDFLGRSELTAVFTSMSKLAFCSLNPRLLSSIFVSEIAKVHRGSNTQVICSKLATPNLHSAKNVWPKFGKKSCSWRIGGSNSQLSGYLFVPTLEKTRGDINGSTLDKYLIFPVQFPLKLNPPTKINLGFHEKWTALKLNHYLINLKGRTN